MLKRPTLQDKEQGQNPPSPGHKWQWIFCSCWLQLHLTRCCRRCLSSGYYEFSSYTIGHPQSSHSARNIEILQRRANCGLQNAEGIQESSWHFRLISPCISNTAPSHKHSEMGQGEYSQPFPGRIFPASGIQCTDIKLPSHYQCSSTPVLCGLLSNLLILWQ